MIIIVTFQPPRETYFYPHTHWTINGYLHQFEFPTVPMSVTQEMDQDQKEYLPFSLTVFSNSTEKSVNNVNTIVKQNCKTWSAQSSYKMYEDVLDNMRTMKSKPTKWDSAKTKICTFYFHKKKGGGGVMMLEREQRNDGLPQNEWQCTRGQILVFCILLICNESILK